MAGCSFPLLDCLPACPVFIRLDPNSKSLCVKAQSFLVITLCDPISTPNISLVSSTLLEHDLVETCWILSPSSAQIHCWLDPVTLLTLLQQHTLEPWVKPDLNRWNREARALSLKRSPDYKQMIINEMAGVRQRCIQNSPGRKRWYLLSNVYML